MKAGILLSLSVLLLFPSWSFAQKPGSVSLKDTVEMKELVIIGQRYHSEQLKRPEAISVIPAKSLQYQSAMSMPDAMMNMPGLWIQKTNHGGGSPFIRGLTGYQTLIMIDGIRLNNGIFRSGPNQYLNTIDPLIINRIEVLRGTGSVQYGTDAIGGTVFLTTKNPVFSESGFKISGQAYANWMSHDMEKTGRGELTLSGKKIAVAGGFTYKNLGDIRAGGDLGRLQHTGYDDYSGDINGHFKLNGQSEINIAYQHHKQLDVPLYHKINPGTYTQYSFDPQQRDLGFIRYKSEFNSPVFSEFSATLSVQHSSETRKKQKSGKRIRKDETDKVLTWGFVLENTSRPGQNWLISSGIETYYDHVNSHACEIHLQSDSETSLRGLYPDNSTLLNMSFFTLHEISLRRLTINTGLRYNYFRLNVEDDEFGKTTVDPQALVGNMALTYRLFERTYLSAITNTAFRTPNINDVSSFGIADFRYEIPNYNLKPEKSTNVEIGLKTQQAPFSFSFHVYRNELTDLITNVTSTYHGQDSIDGYRVYKRKNANKALLRGFEAEAGLKFSKQLKLNTFLMYTLGDNISADEPMRRIPPEFGSTRLVYKPFKQFMLTMEWLYAGKQDRLSSGDKADSRITEEGTPAWNAAHVTASYQAKKFHVNIGLYNIFDKAYRLHGSGVDAPGRSFWVAVKYGIR
jgi:hemoglobin/transferrin/lactoferrin receptor protein